MRVKYILLIVILLIFLTACDSSNYNVRVNKNSFSCENAVFKDESNVYEICEEIYDSYNSYYGGNYSQYVRGSKSQCIESCINAFYISLDNYGIDYTNACSEFIHGGGGFAGIYLPDDFEKPLVKWCENNYRVRGRYLDCFE